jgi:hypothetical protein
MFYSSDVFTDDLMKAYETDNPAAIPETDLVLILLEDNSLTESGWIAHDDGDITKTALALATQISAQRADKNPAELLLTDFVTPIFCSGSKTQLRRVKACLRRQTIFYPQHLITLRSNDSTHLHAQINAAKTFLAATDIKNISVVSSTHQLARVARMIGLESPLARHSRLGELTIFLHGTNKNTNYLGIRRLLQHEHELLRLLSATSANHYPWLTRHTSRNIFFNDIDLTWEKSFNLLTYLPYVLMASAIAGESYEVIKLKGILHQLSIDRLTIFVIEENKSIPYLIETAKLLAKFIYFDSSLFLPDTFITLATALEYVGMFHTFCEPSAILSEAALSMAITLLKKYASGGAENQKVSLQCLLSYHTLKFRNNKEALHATKILIRELREICEILQKEVPKNKPLLNECSFQLTLLLRRVARYYFLKFIPNSGYGLYYRNQAKKYYTEANITLIKLHWNDQRLHFELVLVYLGLSKLYLKSNQIQLAEGRIADATQHLLTASGSYQSRSLLAAHLAIQAAAIERKRSAYENACDYLNCALGVARRYFANTDIYSLSINILVDLTVCLFNAGSYTKSQENYFITYKLAQAQGFIKTAEWLRDKILRKIDDKLIRAAKYPDFRVDLSTFKTKLGKLQKLILIRELFTEHCTLVQQEQFKIIENNLAAYEQYKKGLEADSPRIIIPVAEAAVANRAVPSPITRPHVNSFFSQPVRAANTIPPEAQTQRCRCSIL